MIHIYYCSGSFLRSLRSDLYQHAVSKTIEVLNSYHRSNNDKNKNVATFSLKNTVPGS